MTEYRMMHRVRKVLAALKPSREFFATRNLLRFVLWVVILFGSEYVPEFLAYRGYSHKLWQSLQIQTLYQPLVTLGPRKPRSHFVRLLIFRPGAAPPETLDEHNACPQRAFTARLLENVAAANPAVIVLDKTYPAATQCASTVDFVNAVNDVSARIPLVLGYQARGADELRNLPDLILETLRRKHALVRLPTVDFSPTVIYGSLMADIDNRRLPLDWPMYPSFDSVVTAAPERVPTLAVAAVTAYDTSALEQQRIRKLRAKPEFPFTSFLTEKELGSYSPLSVFCSGAPGAQKGCSAPMIRNRIVVIGDDRASDYQDTPIGEVPGVVLQANYIESLLDDRYLYPAGWITDLILSLIWVAVIEYIFDKISLRWALLVATLVTAIGGLLLYDLCIVQFGIYVMLLPPSLLVIGLNALSRSPLFRPVARATVSSTPAT